MDKKCYCINPSCKCLFGCGCTLADKSVGKCMCCIMEETNQKIDKLRRKKTTTIPSGGGSQCDCDLGDGKFYDIIVVDDEADDTKYVSCRYGCSVEFDDVNFDIDMVNWQLEYIKAIHLVDINNVINNDIKYKLRYNKEPNKIPTFNDDYVLLLFVKKSTLEYVVVKTNKDNIKRFD